MLQIQASWYEPPGTILPEDQLWAAHPAIELFVTKIRLSLLLSSAEVECLSLRTVLGSATAVSAGFDEALKNQR